MYFIWALCMFFTIIFTRDDLSRALNLADLLWAMLFMFVAHGFQNAWDKRK